MIKEYKITLKQIFWYLIIFSVAGLAVETLFCFFTTGNIESRKGLVWGLFCPIYGVGAVVLIIFLNKYKQNSFKLFIAGIIVGNIVEYTISYILEAMYGIRFWEYSNQSIHLNGRICMLYGMYWGVLSMLLIRFLKPIVDNLIHKIDDKLSRPIEIALMIFAIIDVCATVWAMSAYNQRAYNKHYNVSVSTENFSEFERLKKQVEERIFSDEFMRKTFPNVRILDKEGKEMYIRDII